MIATYGGDDTSVPSGSAAVGEVVARADQSISFAPLAGKTFGDADFAIVHYYPNHTTAADVLQQTKLLPAELAQLREQINQYAGPNGPNIAIAMTETASNYQSATSAPPRGRGAGCGPASDYRSGADCIRGRAPLPGRGRSQASPALR